MLKRLILLFVVLFWSIYHRKNAIILTYSSDFDNSRTDCLERKRLLPYFTSGYFNRGIK